MDECVAVLQDAKLPSGAIRLQNCEATALQAVQCVALITDDFDRAAVKFSMEKGMGGGVAGGLEVLKEIGTDSTKALKGLVVGEDTGEKGSLLGESNQEQRDRQEAWLRERGNILLIQCINDAQCLHEMVLRRVTDVVKELLPARVGSAVQDLGGSDFANLERFTQVLNTSVEDAYERSGFEPEIETPGLNAFDSLPANYRVVSHFSRPILKIETVWHDMCKMLSTRIGLGLEDLLGRFLKKMVYRFQPEIVERKEQFEEHSKEFFSKVDYFADAGAGGGTAQNNDAKSRKDREALHINIRDDLVWSFYTNALVGLTDNMRLVVEMRLLQDVFSLITQSLSNMLRDKCRYCVSPSQFGGLSKYFRSVLVGFEDLFLARRAEHVLTSLDAVWVEKATALLREEMVLMAIESTQLIRIANAPPDSMDNATSFGVSRSQIASGILISRRADKKAVQFNMNTASTKVKSSDHIEAALFGRVDRVSDSSFVPVAITKTYRKGWMVKEGQMNKSWKKRWFVLQGSDLNYFEDQNEQLQKGTMKLTSDLQVLPMQRPKSAGLSILRQVWRGWGRWCCWLRLLRWWQ